MGLEHFCFLTTSQADLENDSIDRFHDKREVVQRVLYLYSHAILRVSLTFPENMTKLLPWQGSEFGATLKSLRFPACVTKCNIPEFLLRKPRPLTGSLTCPGKCWSLDLNAGLLIPNPGASLKPPH